MRFLRGLLWALLACVLAVLFVVSPNSPVPYRMRYALAQATCTVPYVFVQGTTIFGDQVNADFTSVLACINAIVPTPHVDNVTALAAASTQTYPVGVWRNSYSTGSVAPPLFFIPQSKPCTTNFYPGTTNAEANDGGSCVNSADGNSWLAIYPGQFDASEFGILPLASNNKVAWDAAVLFSCNGGPEGITMHLGAGDYVFTQVPADPHCPPDIEMDKGATLDFSGMPVAPAGTSALIFTGSEGSTTLLTSNANIGATTLVVTSAAGFCASTTGTDNPKCAVRVGSNAVWDPSLHSHKRGEIKFICGISGLTLTLCEPVEDSYTTAQSAVASPITMLNQPKIKGGTLIGPFGSTGENDWYGIYFQFAYKARISEVSFRGFSGEGTLNFQDSWNPVESYTRYYGIGANSVTYDAYASVDVDATEYAVHDHMMCFYTGPCYTAAFTSTPGSTGHVWVTNSYAFSLIGLNGYAFQTHSAGYDFHFVNNAVERVNSTTVGRCFGIGVPFVEIRGNYCDTSNGQGILVENETNGGGLIIIDGNMVNNVSASCIEVTQGDFSASGVITDVRVVNNRSSICGNYGIFFYNNLTSAIPDVVASNNIITNVSQVANNFYAMSFAKMSQFAITGNMLGGTVNGSAATYAWYMQDPSYGSVTGNTVSVPNGQAIEGLSVHCTAAGSGTELAFANNAMSLDTGVASAGIYFDNNNCINVYATGNMIKAATPITMPNSTGTKGGTVYASTAWTPGTIATGAQATKTVALVGTIIGDICEASLSSSLGGGVLSCYTDSAGDVTAVLSNNTGGNITVGASTLMVAASRNE